jgi:acetyl esterase/lipase
MGKNERWSMVAGENEPKPERHFYGSDPSQFADLHLPTGPRRIGAVVVLHGGFWGSSYGSDNLYAVSVDLARRGWVTWNVEYRRIGIGGGYPTTLLDVASAIDFLASLEDVDTKSVVALGHSAGGHLAAWAAGRGELPVGAPGAGPVVEISGVISLAGVVDLRTAAREKIGHKAAIIFMGGKPDELPEQYSIADPLSRVPIKAWVRCVHARRDELVPFAQSVDYVAAAQAAGQDARLLEVPGDHFSIVDTSSPTWSTVLRTLEDLQDSG